MTWYGPNGGPDFSQSSHTLAYIVRGGSQGDKDIYVMSNMYWEPVTFQVQEGGNWNRIVDTSLESPNDIVAEPGVALPMLVSVQPRSIVVAVSG